MALIIHASPTATKKINDKRVKEIKGGFTYGANTFQTDDVSLNLILGRVIKLLAMRSLGTPHVDFIWRDKDDNNVLFTEAEFISFFIALDEFVEGKMIASWTEKASL